jgi:hypothetical protein
MVLHPGISGASPNVVIARKVSKRTDVAIQSGAWCGMPEAMRLAFTVWSGSRKGVIS